MIKAGVFASLVLLSSLVYFNSLENGYHFDDYHHIVDNPHLKDIRNIPSFFFDTTKFSKTGWQNHYRPLLLVTYALNYYAGRLQPVGYHVVNLAFHVGSAFLVFLIVESMLAGSKEGVAAGFSLRPKFSSPATNLARRLKPAATGLATGLGRRLKPAATGYLLPAACFAALAASLIFAVHPFNSEVVNYITARSSVMSGFFYLLAFYCWVKYRSQATGVTPPPILPPQGGEEKGGGSQSSTVYYLISLLAFLLGMLTKEVVITLPIVLWLYDMYFYRPSRRTQAKACGYRPGTQAKACGYYAYLPFVLLVAVPYIVLSGHLAEGLMYEGRLPRSYYVNLLTGTKVLTRYVQMLFVPVDLSVDHVVQNARHFWEWEVIASTGFLAGILVLGLWLYRRSDAGWRIVSFFILWFFVTLLPTTIIPLEAMLQENRGYLSGVSFAIIVGIGLGKGMGEDVAAGFSLRPKSRVRGAICIAVTCILIVIFSIMTIQRNRVWKDELTLWTDAAIKYPMSARAHFALGNFYKRNGDIAIAIESYRKVLDLDPDYYEAHNNLGVLYFKEGAIDLAIEEFKRALSIMPAHLNARMGLGKALMKKGETEMAKKEFEAAVTLARVTHQDTVIRDAMSYLKWIKERAIFGEINQ